MKLSVFAFPAAHAVGGCGRGLDLVLKLHVARAGCLRTCRVLRVGAVRVFVPRKYFTAEHRGGKHYCAG